jgi:branched-chain amino acid transport system substrate-binding protein
MMGAKGITDNAAKYNVSIIITEKFDPKDTNMTLQLSKIKAARPDAILLYGSAPPAIVISKKLPTIRNGYPGNWKSWNS